MKLSTLVRSRSSAEASSAFPTGNRTAALCGSALVWPKQETVPTCIESATNPAIHSDFECNDMMRSTNNREKLG